MFFLNPGYLWAFLGLIIPIAIHLWSKREGKVIKIGSIQLLQQADTQQSRSIKLNELWLLVLRLFLLSVLVLILAKPHIKKRLDHAALTYIVEPSLLQNKEFKTLLDTIAKEIPIRLLQNDFPAIDLEAKQPSNPTIPNYWQLAKAMQSLPSDSIIVFTNAYQAGFKGIRPLITKPIEWIPIPEDKTSQHLLEANRFNEQVELLLMNASNQQVSFDKKVVQPNNPNIKWSTTKDSIYYLEQWTAVNTKKTQEVLLFYDADFSAEIKYFEASFKVVAAYLNHKINLTKTDEQDQIADKAFDIIIWLSKEPIPNTAGKVLVFKPNPSAGALIERSSTQKDTYYLTRFLDNENIETDHLPEQLIPLLELHPKMENKINQYDLRVMAKEAIIPAHSVSTVGPADHYRLDMTKWLWFLFILLLASERILSYYRSQ